MNQPNQPVEKRKVEPWVLFSLAINAVAVFALSFSIIEERGTLLVVCAFLIAEFFASVKYLERKKVSFLHMLMVFAVSKICFLLAILVLCDNEIAQGWSNLFHCKIFKVYEVHVALSLGQLFFIYEWVKNNEE